MSRRASPVAVGGFVIGALALAVTATLLLGQSRWFGQSLAFVIYFNESVRGLNVGSPVAYRGVNVGEVTGIVAEYSRERRDMVAVPVTIRINPDSLTVVDRQDVTEEQLLKELIASGLRAQLQIQSIVTAQLYIALDFFPGQPALFLRGSSKLPEIPSIPGPLAGIQRSVDEITMATPRLLADLESILSTTRDILTGDAGNELRRAIGAGTALADKLGDPAGPLMTVLDRVPALEARLTTTLTAAEALATDLKTKLGARDEQLGALLVDMTRTLVSVQRAADQASTLIAQNREGIKTLTGRGIPEILGLVEDADRMINEMSGLVRDVRQDPARFLFSDQVRQGVKLK